MAYRKINSASMRKNNARMVLDMIRASDGISRKELAQQIGLTTATITNIVSHLIEAGYIREGGAVESNTSGRRQIQLSINPGACNVIGIELSASKIICILADFATNILCRRQVPIPEGLGRDAVIDKMVGLIDGVIVTAGVCSESVRGVGLSTPGPYNLDAGIMLNPPNLKGWENTPIRDIIEKKTGFPVIFEHHMAAAGFCEVRLGDAKTSKCMFLCAVLEIGVAGSLLIDGKIFHGFRNGSGEIGHMIIDQNGPLCHCGNYGCLEPVAESRALVNAVKMQLKADAALREKYGIGDADAIDLAYIIRHAERGEEIFHAELVKSARYIAIALSNIINIISPDTIVLTGKLPYYSKLYVEEVRKYIHGRVYPKHNTDVKIYASKFGENIGAMGGVAMILDRISKSI